MAINHDRGQSILLIKKGLVISRNGYCLVRFAEAAIPTAVGYFCTSFMWPPA